MFEDLESSGSLRIDRGGRIPACSKELCSMRESVAAPTEVYPKWNNPRHVDQDEVVPERRLGTATTVSGLVAELNTETERLQGNPTEVVAVPLLWRYINIRYDGRRAYSQTYQYPMKMVTAVVRDRA